MRSLRKTFAIILTGSLLLSIQPYSSDALLYRSLGGPLTACLGALLTVKSLMAVSNSTTPVAEAQGWLNTLLGVVLLADSTHTRVPRFYPWTRKQARQAGMTENQQIAYNKATELLGAMGSSLVHELTQLSQEGADEEALTQYAVRFWAENLNSRVLDEDALAAIEKIRAIARHSTI